MFGFQPKGPFSSLFPEPPRSAMAPGSATRAPGVAPPRLAGMNGPFSTGFPQHSAPTPAPVRREPVMPPPAPSMPPGAVMKGGLAFDAAGSPIGGVVGGWTGPAAPAPVASAPSPQQLAQALKNPALTPEQWQAMTAGSSGG